MALLTSRLPAAAAAAVVPLAHACTRRRLRWAAKILGGICVLTVYVAVLLRQSLHGIEQQELSGGGGRSAQSEPLRVDAAAVADAELAGYKRIYDAGQQRLTKHFLSKRRRARNETVSAAIAEATRRALRRNAAARRGPPLKTHRRRPPPNVRSNNDPTGNADDRSISSSIGTPRASTTGRTATAAITANPMYEYSAEQNAATQADLQRRHDTLAQACARRSLQRAPPAPNAWEFFVSPGHGLAWCNVFKAASSTWLYYFNVLAGYDPAYLRRTKRPPLEMARHHFPRPGRAELDEAMQSALSFLVVREPFERLLSAYRDKLEGQHKKYYRRLCAQIVRRFRKAYKPHGGGPTFSEFVQYVIASSSSRTPDPTTAAGDQTGDRMTSAPPLPATASASAVDEHWRPISEFCTPCSLNYTLIAKVETFRRDTEYIIRQAGLESVLLTRGTASELKAVGNQAAARTADLVAKYFAQINSDQLRDLLEIYGADFELFGYDSSKYWGLVQPVATVAATGATMRADKQTTNP